MLFTTSSRIFMAQTGWDQVNGQSILLVGIDGNIDTHFHPAFIAFSLSKTDDMQELDLLSEITGITGEVKWESQLVGKRVRLIVDVVRESWTKVEVIPYAIGHKKEKDGDDDYFIVLNSKRELLTEEKAMELITDEFLQK